MVVFANSVDERVGMRSAHAFTASGLSMNASPAFDLNQWRASLSGRQIVLAVMWMVIGLVASYDAYLAIKYQHVLEFHEMNPLGRWLIGIDGGSVALFVGCKFAGTVFTLGALVVLALAHHRMAMAVSGVLAALQLVLFGYLLFA